jgi:predicted metal-dependent phosphoesterase TrpH
MCTPSRPATRCCGWKQLARRAVELGVDVVFVTDHNEISVALTAQGRDLGVRSEVGEEVRTADGEVLGLTVTARRAL